MAYANGYSDQQQQRYGGGYGGGYSDGGAFEKRPMVRRTIDYGSSLLQWRLLRNFRSNRRDQVHLRPFAADILNMLVPQADPSNTALSLPLKHIHTSANKVRHVVNFVRWTPQGRRVLTGSSVGEFTLWNGASFNFELLNQAHDDVVRCAEWSRDGKWLLSGDGEGQVKYWQSNLNNVRVIKPHEAEVRDLAFSPTGSHFITASDDATLKLVNFNEGREERTLSGHGWDVKCCDWHQTKSLIVSGSKDNLLKFWDPRTEKCILTLHNHKNTVMQCAFAPFTNTELVASCSRDSSSLIFDIRQMRPLHVLLGHREEVTSLAWHTQHRDLISTGSSDGSINHYILSEAPVTSQRAWQAANPSVAAPVSENNVWYPTATVPYAHELAIWSMQYHPLGHVLCSGGNDKTVRFWARARPEDPRQLHDKFHLGENATVDQLRRPYSAGDDDSERYQQTVDRERASATAASAAVPGLSSSMQQQQQRSDNFDFVPGMRRER